MTLIRSLRRFAGALSLVTVGLFALASPTRAESLKAITTTGVLISFDSATPGTLSSQVGVIGLQAGENILGIDFRPATGTLYGLGSTSRLYTIDLITGASTQVGSAGLFTLSGTSFGFDFNPTVDRIRVTSESGQNVRLNPDNGTLAGTDTALNPPTPRVVGSAYTNNFLGAVTTTLYDIDSAVNSLLLQGNPNPNGGVLTPVGPLGVDFADLAGFDISGLSGIAYAALTAPTGNSSSLYTINLATGVATLVGTIGGPPGVVVNSLAAPIGAGPLAPVPEPATLVLMAAGLAGGARRWRAARRLKGGS